MTSQGQGLGTTGISDVTTDWQCRSLLIVTVAILTVQPSYLKMPIRLHRESQLLSLLLVLGVYRLKDAHQPGIFTGA